MKEILDEESRNVLVQYRMEQALSALSDADLLLQNMRLNAAANRLYYACFYATEALLIKNAIPTTTHAGMRNMFSLKFVQTGLIEPKWGRFLTQIEQMRKGADYDFFIKYEESELQEILPLVQEYIQVLRRLI